MPGLFDEIAARLPVTVLAAAVNENELIIGGSDWHLRVSGPWRLTRSGVIVTSSSMELAPETSGRIHSIVGSSIESVSAQSRGLPIDIAVTLSDGGFLELFSENTYDDWLLNLGGLIIEGPMSDE